LDKIIKLKTKKTFTEKKLEIKKIRTELKNIIFSKLRLNNEIENKKNLNKRAKNKK
jgi:hypothetical protein